jgi:hypothetical protein
VALAAVLAEPAGSPVWRPGAEARAAPPPVAIPAAAPRRPAALYTARSVQAAQLWASTRPGVVAFAVMGEGGRLRGWRRTFAFPSASVVKAMLMVAQLRAAGPAPIAPAVGRELELMVTESDNDAALAVFARVGRAGLDQVARAVRMAGFSVAGHLFDARITPADQVRLFLRIDRIVPRRHRADARRLLGSVIAPQRWGIARVAERRGFTPYFKGGWRPGLVHQAALLERGSRRVALAVLTSGQRATPEGIATIEGIARRVLVRPARPVRGRVLAPFAAGLSRS